LKVGDMNMNAKKIGLLIVGFILLIVLLDSFGTVNAGERGIRTRFGAVTGVVEQGFYVKLPFIESVRTMSVQVQKEQVEADAASSDLQTVKSQIALNFHLDPARVGDIYQNIGVGYKDTVIAPALQESMKDTTAKFTAEQLITNREAVRTTMKQTLSDKLIGRGIIVDDMNIVNFDFSVAFNQAIESKVTAEQNALAAKNKLQQVQFEAQQAQAEATGKAQAITIEAQALRDNPQVLELRALEKWNGVLPQYTGGAIPFINVK
jgi:regulator of protease activity HflC (stomatin/prohibitin superfamily)